MKKVFLQLKISENSSKIPNNRNEIIINEVSNPPSQIIHYKEENKDVMPSLL